MSTQQYTSYRDYLACTGALDDYMENIILKRGIEVTEAVKSALTLLRQPCDYTAVKNVLSEGNYTWLLERYAQVPNHDSQVLSVLEWMAPLKKTYLTKFVCHPYLNEGVEVRDKSVGRRRMIEVVGIETGNTKWEVATLN